MKQGLAYISRRGSGTTPTLQQKHYLEMHFAKPKLEINLISTVTEQRGQNNADSYNLFLLFFPLVTGEVQ